MTVMTFPQTLRVQQHGEFLSIVEFGGKRLGNVLSNGRCPVALEEHALASALSPLRNF